MSTDVWILIGVIILMLLILAIIVFLESIGVIDYNTGEILFMCIMIPPIALVFLIAYGYISFSEFCEKHKDKIRRFLRIKN